MENETRNIEVISVESDVTEEKKGIVKTVTSFVTKHKGKFIAGVVGLGAVTLGAIKLLGGSSSEECTEDLD